MTRLRNGLTAAQNRILTDVWETGYRIYHGASHDVAISALEKQGLVEVDRAYYRYQQRSTEHFDQRWWCEGVRITVWTANGWADWQFNARRDPSDAGGSGASAGTVA